MYEPKANSPLKVPMTTYFTEQDAAILRLLEKTTPYSTKQIIRYATRKYITELLCREQVPSAGNRNAENPSVLGG